MIPLFEYLKIKFPKKKKPDYKIPLDYFTIKIFKFSALVVFFSGYDSKREAIYTKYKICYKINPNDSEGWFEEGFFYDSEENVTFESFIRKKVELKIHSINLPEIRALFSQKNALGVSE